jgi:hypothetical protein
MRRDLNDDDRGFRAAEADDHLASAPACGVQQVTIRRHRLLPETAAQVVGAGLPPMEVHPIEGDRRPTASASSTRALPQPGEIALPGRLEHTTAE